MSTSFQIPEQTIHIDVEGDTFNLDMRELGNLCRIDPNQLDLEMREQSAMYVWVGMLAANAKAYAEQLKQEMKLLTSELVKEVRRGYEGQGKPPAKDIIVMEAQESAEYIKASDDYLAAQKTADLAEVAREAVKMRQFLLTVLGNNRRSEEHADAQS